MHYMLRLAMRPPFTSMHDSIPLSKIAGSFVVWTRPAVSPTLICAFVVSASSGPLPQEAPVMIAERHGFYLSFLFDQRNPTSACFHLCPRAEKRPYVLNLECVHVTGFQMNWEQAGPALHPTLPA